MAIFPFVLVKSKSPSEVLLNHERIHLAQQIELFILPFYCWYFLAYCWNRFKGQKHHQAYRNVIFEKEAYENDENLQYLTSRKNWEFIKYR